MPAFLHVVLDAAPLRDSRGTSGIGRYVAGLATALRERDDVEISATRPGLPPWPDVWTMRYLNSQPALLRARLSHRNAVLHCTSGDPAATWPLRRQVITVHDILGLTGHDRERRGLRAAVTGGYFGWQRRRLPSCAAIIAVSNDTASATCAQLDIDPERVHVIPEGVSDAFTAIDHAGADANHRHSVDAPARYVLWVGSMLVHDPRKQLDLLVEAVTQLRLEPEDNDLGLVCVGATGPEAERIAARAHQRELPVTMPGHVSDAILASLYRGAAVVAVPSRHEGFGLPVIEAMACGAPVVATTGGNLNVLGANGAALLVEPGNVGAFTMALHAVLDDPERARYLRERGLVRAAGYSWARAAESTVAVYRAVADRDSFRRVDR